MSKKSIITTILKYVALLAVTAYLVLAIVKAVRPRGGVVCTGVDICVEGDTLNALIDRAGVERILATHRIKPEGMSFSEIDLGRIDSLVASNPYVDTVAAYPLSSGLLRIWLRAAEPLLHAMPEGGKEFYIDVAGNTLPANGGAVNLPIATGKVTGAAARESLLALGLLLRDDPYWRLETQQIDIADNGDLRLVPRTGDHTIVLGDTTDLIGKLRRVRLFYEKALPEAGWDTYKTINAEFDGQLVCTRK